MEKRSDSEITVILSSIWRRLLGKEQIGGEENFFDLGGNPWLAIELFREIEKTFGRLLSPLVIYQAPTVDTLAVVLETSNSIPFPQCVLLKAGDLEPPIFLSHGLGGNIMEFFDLVQHLQSSRSVYGLQARGTDGMEAPCSSIEEMAQFHVEAIRTIQLHGPYILVGYSLGGLIALEMARYLAKDGENIALLVMIDSYASLVHAPLTQRIRVFSRKAKYYASKWRRSGSTKPITDATQRRGHLSDEDLFTESEKAEILSLGIAFTPAMSLVREESAKALKRYQPRYYEGRIRFARAATPLHFPDDPKKVWAKYVNQFEMESVPGDHHELLTTQYETLAAVISRYLSELSSERSKGSSQQ